jgi:hypothetical protein
MKTLNGKPIPENARMLWIGDELRYVLVPESILSHSYTGTCWQVTAAYDGDEECDADEVAKIYLKWDGCCHLGLRDPQLGNEWTHVCGAKTMEETLAMLRWMWVQAQQKIEAYEETEILPS